MNGSMPIALVVLLASFAAQAQDEAGDLEAPAEDEAAVEEGAPEDEAAAEDEVAAEEGAAEEPAVEDTAVEDEAAAEEAAVEEAAVDGEVAAEESEAEDDLGMDDDYVPGMEETVPYDDQLAEDAEPIDDGKPFAKGDMELGIGIVAGGGGYFGSSTFVLGAGGAFAYYVVNRLAPGIQLQYVHVFSEYEYPDDFRVLPFLKFVIVRSTKFAPYLVLAGGRDFEWGGTDNPAKGFPAVSSWLLGGGAGAHIGLGARASMNIQLLALYHWFDEKVALAGKDGLHDGALEFPILSLSIAFFF
jgi:hypothetical protein